MSFLTTTPRAIRAFIVGESYWKVRLDRRIGDMVKTEYLSELDKKTYLLNNQEIRVRSAEWKEDIIDSGDLRNVKEAMLCTPQGTAHFTVTEPYTVFQFSRGTLAALTGERIKNVQVVGVVIDKDSGECECAIWDQQTIQLYTMVNNVKSFTAWREGVIDIGALNLVAMDLRGIG